MPIKNLAIEKKNSPKKGTEDQRRFGVTKDDIKRAVATNYTIDCNKRGTDGSTGNEPRMTK